MDNKNCLELHSIYPWKVHFTHSSFKVHLPTPFLAHLSSPNFHRSLSTKDITSFSKEKIKQLNRNPLASSPNKEEPQLLSETNLLSCTLALQPFQGWHFCHYSSLSSSMNVSLSTGSCPSTLNHAPNFPFLKRWCLRAHIHREQIGGCHRQGLGGE